MPTICCNPYFCNAPVARAAAVHCWHSLCQAFQLSEVMGYKHTGLRFNSFGVSFRMDRARGTPPGKEIKCTHTEAHRDRRSEIFPRTRFVLMQRSVTWKSLPEELAGTGLFCCNIFFHPQLFTQWNDIQSKFFETGSEECFHYEWSEKKVR